MLVSSADIMTRIISSIVAICDIIPVVGVCVCCSPIGRKSLLRNPALV